MQILQTPNVVGLTYRKKGPPKDFGMGPPDTLIRPCMVAIN